MSSSTIVFEEQVKLYTAELFYGPYIDNPSIPPAPNVRFIFDAATKKLISVDLINDSERLRNDQI